MKYKKTLILLFSAIMLISAALYYNYKNLNIVLLNDQIKADAYTLKPKKYFLDKVDYNHSNFDHVDIYISNDNEKEFNIESDLESLYNSYNLKINNSNLIPIGKNIKVTFKYSNKLFSKELSIKQTLNDINTINFYNSDNSTVKLNETINIDSKEKWEDKLKFKAYKIRFNENYKELPLQIDHDININNNSDYILKLSNKESNINEKIKINVNIEENIIKEQDIVIDNEGAKDKKPGVKDQKAIEASSEDKSDNTQVNSTDINTLVNKEYHLSPNFVPPLKSVPAAYAINSNYVAHPEAVDQFMLLVDTMLAESSMKVIVVSAYRSYSYQQQLFDNYVKRDGLAAAEKYSARPGQSEHQTGLALDITKPGLSFLNFENTNESLWINENAHRFGFVVRYEKNKEAITGYMYEPWHLRYLGPNLASKVKTSGLCYDEYYNAYIK